MKKKQMKGLFVAAAVFAAVGVLGILSNVVSSLIVKDTETSKTGSFVESLMGSSEEAVLSDMPEEEDFIAVLPVDGVIQGSQDGIGLYGGSGYNHNFLMNYVNRLIQTDNNRGIVLRLNTPGGTVYEADELYLKLMEYKEKTGRPVWAYMESQCCSGGVYVASAADEQYANRITTTGSIGVIMSGYDMSELYKKLGIRETNIVSGRNKDMGTAGKPMTPEQEAILQSIVDEYYDQFVGIVAEGRKMSVPEVKKLADGRIYTAKQAVKNGLIDGIKTSEEFDAYVKEQGGVEILYEPEPATDYFSAIFGSLSSLKEKSEAEVLVDLMNQLGSGVPMYYAE